MYLSLKSPSGARRHIETSWQGALCTLLLHTGEHSRPQLQLHPSGNTAFVCITQQLVQTATKRSLIKICSLHNCIPDNYSYMNQCMLQFPTLTSQLKPHD